MSAEMKSPAKPVKRSRPCGPRRLQFSQDSLDFMSLKHLRIPIAFTTILLFASTARTVDWLWPVPEWAASALMNAGVNLASTPTSEYTLKRHLNPAVLFGDFDGDHRTDAAILVRQAKTSKIGIAVALRTGRVDVFGAGMEFGNGGRRCNLGRKGRICQCNYLLHPVQLRLVPTG